MPKFFADKDVPKPRDSRVKNLDSAHIEVHKHYDELTKQLKKVMPKYEKANKKVLLNYDQDIEKLAKGSKTSILDPVKATAIELKRDSLIRESYPDIYYSMLQKQLNILNPTPEPDIDRVLPDYIKPGRSVSLWGTNFGPSQGKVYATIAPNTNIELEVSVWEETYITASVNRLYGETGLSPYYGKLWVCSGSGECSNVWNIMYEPVYGLYAKDYYKFVYGDMFGKSVDGTAFPGKTLNPYFRVTNVSRRHSRDGWSSLRHPHAGGSSLEQGWHIGVSAFHSACMYITYTVTGPKGLAPSSGIGGWFYLGDAE